ncbi:hypothetical protein JL39_20510 [Rhizobium sp. YS-1r]|nr:hypothetical protein JL39_20510 [Rhizobium sp. YS-1r]
MRQITLPLRGRVGAKLRGGVSFASLLLSVGFQAIPLNPITPTRRFAATSPLKGEVSARRVASECCEDLR